jgi:hypothetical protein
VKKFLFILLVSTQCYAETVKVNGKDMEINPATGFLVASTPKWAEGIEPNPDTLDYGVGITNAGSRTYSGYSAGNTTIVVPNGTYMVSRVGSTTYVTQTSRSRR